MRVIKSQSGQALVLIMIMTSVFLLMGSSMLAQTSQGLKASYEERNIVQAYYIAEAGAEKAVAEIKNNPFWLKGLASNIDVMYIGNPAMDYAGGQITSVKVKRTSSTDNPTLFSITSIGEYQGAKRTIEVQGKMYDPIAFSRGVWISSADSQFDQNSVLDSDVTVQEPGTIYFENNCAIYRTITAVGDVVLRQNMTATKVVTSGSVKIENNAQVTTDVEAGGNVTLDNNTRINGATNAVGNVTLDNNAVIGGDVYFDGTLTNNGGSTGALHPGEAHAVNVNVPPFPALDQYWFCKNADRTLSGNLSGSFNVDGISYIPGDISISGTYFGKGAIVAGGKVTISGNLTRGNTDSSLAVIAFGSPVGIETSNNLSVYALLYSPNQIILANGTYLYGSAVCNQIVISQGVRVNDDDLLQDKQPQWITTVVRITSWKEKFSVF